MKNDKNNSLSIMNVSNNSTLDVLIDNQNVLKSSLNKTFDENTKFNLDFLHQMKIKINQITKAIKTIKVIKINLNNN